MKSSKDSAAREHFAWCRYWHDREAELHEFYAADNEHFIEQKRVEFGISAHEWKRLTRWSE